MKGFPRLRRAPKPCTLHVLSDHQLRDIGLSRFGIAFVVVAGTDSQASVHPPCDSPKQLATRGSEPHPATLSVAMMLTLKLFVASKWQLWQVDEAQPKIRWCNIMHNRMGAIRLSGFLRCGSIEEVDLVKQYLPDHLSLTRAEPGCISFDVMQTEDALVWRVEELFIDRAAFDFHQQRTRASKWFYATSTIPREYKITASE